MIKANIFDIKRFGIQDGEIAEEIYQYIRKNIKEDGVTAQSIAEIFGIKRNVASHYLNLLEKEGKLQKRN